MMHSLLVYHYHSMLGPKLYLRRDDPKYYPAPSKNKTKMEPSFNWERIWANGSKPPLVPLLH
jgi:hypothetical protein